jgi:hypothetical protein
VAIAVALIMIVTAYVLAIEIHPSAGSSAVVLVPYGTGYSLSGGEPVGITFTVSSESSIDGTLNSSRGIQIYIMTPQQFETLANYGNVSTYVWTSGRVANGMIYALHLTVSPGQWVLAFVNPNPDSPTGVGFYSNVTLKPS